MLLKTLTCKGQLPCGSGRMYKYSCNLHLRLLRIGTLFRCSLGVVFYQVGFEVQFVAGTAWSGVKPLTAVTPSIRNSHMCQRSGVHGVARQQHTFRLPTAGEVTAITTIDQTVILRSPEHSRQPPDRGFTSFGQPTRLITCANSCHMFMKLEPHSEFVLTGCQ